MSNEASTTHIAMALYRERVKSPLRCNEHALQTPGILSLHQAVWLEHGSLRCNDNVYRDHDGFELPVDTSASPVGGHETIAIRFLCLLAGGDSPLSDTDVTAFLEPELPESSRESPSCISSTRETIATHVFSTRWSGVVLRLDRVNFPPGAIAYRHTHPGGGFRYLTRGSLTLHTDHDARTMAPGDAWFEPADSPVRAVADDRSDSQFIRMMLLPRSYENRSSFTLCDASDGEKPRLQTTDRFFDRPIDLEIT